MKVPLRWLAEFIDLPTTDIEELSSAFDMLGLTVEGVRRLEAGWSDVFVGEVLDISAHPDADKVRVCQVDSGAGATQIICGAWNFERGARVAVARPGAVLPGDFEIGVRNIRGVESNGMICSERELGLGDDHTGILVLDGDPQIGLEFASMVELPDVIFEVEVTTNRSDALSLTGVARDLGAWFGVEHHVPAVELITSPGTTRVGVEIADPTGCRRFTAREIAGVSVGRSPLRIRHRLHKVGVRSISNVVDATNYVMFELGHPLHAFDADSIQGDRLVVKRAVSGETLTTLDGVERTLTPDDLIIYDDAGPTSMSGTMGGARSEVSEKTSRVLMEAASWDPPTIMYMWRRHDLRSEAATRFERGVDPNLADVANQRACAMVRDLAGGEVLEGAVDEVAVTVAPTIVDLEVSEVERLLGPGVKEGEISTILRRLGMGVEGSDPLRVTVPTFRPDLTRPADLVEEIARIHGFDEFEATIPTGPTGGLTPDQRRQRKVMSVLTGIGLTQAITVPFVSLETMRHLRAENEPTRLLTLKNPLRDQESRLRPSLLPGLLDAVKYNQSHGTPSVALFEVGKVFTTEPDPDDERLPLEFDRLSWAMVGEAGLRSLAGSETLADGEVSLAIWRHLCVNLGINGSEQAAANPGFHPGRTAAVSVGGSIVGHVGELAPSVARAFEIEGRVAVAEIDLAPLLVTAERVQASAPSLFPPLDFDISFLVPEEVPAAVLVNATVAAGGALVESARVFDVFHGAALEEGNKAVAIRYRLRARDRTLESTELAAVRDAMIEAGLGVGAQLRGV